MSTEKEKEVKNSENTAEAEVEVEAEVEAEAETSKKEKKKKPEKEKKSFNKRKFKYGAVATTITVAFTAIIVLLNVLFSVITDRFGMKIDTTKEKIFEVSSQTTDYLSGLTKEVEISVMADEIDLENSSTYTKMVREVLEKYSVCSDMIKVDYYDIEKNPGIVSKFSGLTSEDIRQGAIIVSCDNRIKQIQMDDLFELEMNNSFQQEVTGFKAEEVLTSAVMYVSNEKPATVTILTVQQSESVEASLSLLKTTFENNGFDVSEVDPLNEDIDPETDIVVLPTPSTDLLDGVIDKLDKYLYNDGNLGKNLLYFANFDQREMPKMDAFLEEWGIQVNSDIVEETQNSKLINVGVQGMMQYVNVPSVTVTDEYASYANTKIPMVMPASRSITLLFDEKDDRSTASILKSSDSAALYSLVTGEMGSQTDEYTVMACGSKHIYQDADKVSSNVIVSGSAFFLDSYVIQTNGLNNLEFFTKMMAGLSGKEMSITVQAKNLSETPITVKESVVSFVNVFVMIFIPLAVGIAGIIVAVRRSKR